MFKESLRLHIFIILNVPLKYIKISKFTYVHKSSKSSDIDFQFPKSRIFHDFRYENLEVKIFCNFFSKYWLVPDLQTQFYLFISLHHLSTSLKTSKFIHALKSSKWSKIDFDVSKSHVFHDFRHENFWIKFFCKFFTIHWFISDLQT